MKRIGELRPLVKHGLVLCFWMVAAADPLLAQRRLFTTADEINHLSRAEADSGYPAKVRGVVTYADVKIGFVFLQDPSGGTFAFFEPSSFEGSLPAGTLVAVEGVTTAGAYSPCIQKGKLQVLGRAALPEPLRLPLDELISGRWVTYWAELAGMITSYTVRPESIEYVMRGSGGSALVIVPGKSTPWQWVRASGCWARWERCLTRGGRRSGQNFLCRGRSSSRW